MSKRRTLISNSRYSAAGDLTSKRNISIILLGINKHCSPEDRVTDCIYVEELRYGNLHSAVSSAGSNYRRLLFAGHT